MSVDSQTETESESEETTLKADVLSNGDVQVHEGDTSYTVYLDNAGRTRCTCAKFKVRKEDCDHIEMVENGYFDNVNWPAPPQ